MLQYVNEFSCTSDENNKTMVIHFIQNEPKIEVDGNGNQKIVPVKNDIISVVMETEGAQALANIINQVIESVSSENNEDTRLC